ncbi:MAG: ribonuclease Z [Bacteroidales bacterium]
MEFNITILGNNSAIPTLKRNPTAQLINHNQKIFLIDCGEGTQMQLRRYRLKMQRISQIFISHLHGDHYFGLIGLISTMHLLGRNDELHVYGPEPLDHILKIQLEASQTELNYPFHFHAINPDIHEIIFENEKLAVSTIPMNHRVPTCGFLFREKKGSRKILKEKINALKIPVDQFLNIKKGEDFIDEKGNIHKNATLTSEPIPPRSYAYCSDTKYHEPIIPLIRNVDLLYHEATFLHDRAESAAEKYHSTAVEAATIAKKAGAKKLLIGHFSNRYENAEELVSEARGVFENTFLASEGKAFKL